VPEVEPKSAFRWANSRRRQPLELSISTPRTAAEVSAEFAKSIEVGSPSQARTLRLELLGIGKPKLVGQVSPGGFETSLVQVDRGSVKFVQPTATGYVTASDNGGACIDLTIRSNLAIIWVVVGLFLFLSTVVFVIGAVVAIRIGLPGLITMAIAVGILLFPLVWSWLELDSCRRNEQDLLGRIHEISGASD
jgi:hypothetical protein